MYYWRGRIDISIEAETEQEAMTVMHEAGIALQAPGKIARCSGVTKLRPISVTDSGINFFRDRGSKPGEPDE